MTEFDFCDRELLSWDTDRDVRSRPVEPSLVPVPAPGVPALVGELRDGRRVREPSGFDVVCLRSVPSVLKEVTSWAHAPREFQAEHASDPPKARTALRLIPEGYAIEDSLRERTELERLESR